MPNCNVLIISILFILYTQHALHNIEGFVTCDVFIGPYMFKYFGLLLYYNIVCILIISSISYTAAIAVLVLITKKTKLESAVIRFCRSCSACTVLNICSHMQVVWLLHLYISYTHTYIYT